MASSSLFLITFHRGGVFVRNPLSYDYEMVSKIENVDLRAMDFHAFVRLLETESSGIIKSIFYLVPGTDVATGLRSLKSNVDLNECVEYGLSNECKLDIYVTHSEFELNEGSDSELDDNYEYDCYGSDDDSDTASIDHLSDDDEEVLEVRTKKTAPKPKLKASKMFDENFLTNIYNGLPRDDFVEKERVDDENNKEDEDKLGDQWPIHDPSVKWKFMKPLLGERYESPDQLKRALAFYALANGYKLYYSVVTPKRIFAKCNKDNLDRKCPFRLWASWMQFEKSFQIKTLVDDHACSKTYEYGTLITSNWIARNYAKTIMLNPSIKIRDIQALILKKYKCKVTISQARRGKVKALKQYETCLQDHYGMLWSYAEEVITSNPGSSCMMSIETMPDGKPYFKSFYVCFKGLKVGWLAGCRRVIGLDGCFLKTICKGQLLSAVGRDGNNQIYPIAWAVVNVENKENWSWFMKCLIEDLQITGGECLTIISDQHKVLLLVFVL